MVIFEQLIVIQLNRKIPITEPKWPSMEHLLSHFNLTFLEHTSVRPTLILSYHLCLGSPSNILYEFLVSLLLCTCSVKEEMVR
jgi:hypothetical protein